MHIRKLAVLPVLLLAPMVAQAAADEGQGPEQAQVQPYGDRAGPAILVVDAARLFDGRKLIENARLIIRDGHVSALAPRAALAAPAGARRVDLGDHVIIPGLIAGHSHVGMVSGVDAGGQHYTRDIVRKDLRQFQRYGIVAVNALGMNGALFHELRKEALPQDQADLYGAGGGIGAVAGAPPASMNPPGAMIRAKTPREATQAVDQMADAGVDMIKIWVDDFGGQAPKMPPEIYQAVIKRAHERGLKAAAHIHDLDDAKNVLRAGVDIIGHGVRDRAVDQEFIDLIKESGAWYVPTININEAEYIYADHPEWLEDAFFKMALNPALETRLRDTEWRKKALNGSASHRRAVATNIANLRLLHRAGVNIGFGTDSGATPLRIPGFAEHLELGHMVAAGLSPAEALAAATSSTAAMMGTPDRGCLVAGCRADFLVLAADPTQDIRNSRSIVALWRDGKPIPQADALE